MPKDAGLLLPRRNCKAVTLADPAAGDLGDLLTPLLQDYRCLVVTLKASTVWTWNKRIEVQDSQILVLVGEGYTNSANNITVYVRMTQSAGYTSPDCAGERRDPSRVLVRDNARFSIEGVRITEGSSPSDTRPMTCQGGRALFTSTGSHSIIAVQQTIIDTTEDVVGVFDWALVHVRFGHLWIRSGAGKSIKAVKLDYGWGYGGAFAFVSKSHTHFVGDVSIDTAGSPSIQVSEYASDTADHVPP